MEVVHCSLGPRCQNPQTDTDEDLPHCYDPQLVNGGVLIEEKDAEHR